MSLEELTRSPMAPRDLTYEEDLAVKALLRLAKRWPRSLTLASMGGTLCVIPTDAEPVGSLDLGYGLDQEAVVTTIDIPNTGGDW